jgi:cold shock CspA family protein
MRTPHPPVVGVVEVWHSEDGWGVLRTPDGIKVWCHFAHLPRDGDHVLIAGEAARFDYETPGQDGYEARVFSGAEPVVPRPPVAGPEMPAVDESGAYWSSLTVTWDEPPKP